MTSVLTMSLSGLAVLLLTAVGAHRFYRRREPPLWIREPFAVGLRDRPRRILISGGSGFIGRHLVRSLLADGNQLVVLSRDPQRISDLFGPHVDCVLDLDAIPSASHIDAIINLAGASLGVWPWTSGRRAQLLNRRVAITQDLCALIERLQHRPEVLISASAIGFYGDRGEKRMIESDSPGDGFQSVLCQAWEQAARQAEASGVRVCRLRIGLVLSAHGGLLPALMRPMLARCCVYFGHGKQWMSWIHRHDLVRLVLFLLDTPAVRGAVNATAPGAERHEDLLGQLAKRRRTRLEFRLSARLLHALPGQMAERFTASARVVPLEAQAHGFEFEFASLNKALDELLEAPDKVTACEVYYDGACPLCSAEIAHYTAANHRSGGSLSFLDLAKLGAAHAVNTLDRETARQRLYVRLRNGRVVSGIDAFIAIWRSLPNYRWLARAADRPVIRPALAIVYDLVAAPLVSSWSERRRSKTEVQHG